MLSTATAGPLMQRYERAAGRVAGGMEERLRGRAANRRPVGVAREDQLAAGGEHSEIGCRPRRLRSRCPERADRDGDEGGVRLAQCREVDRHGSGFEEHVAATSQITEQRLPVPRREVDHDAALSAAVAPERERRVRVAAEGRHGPRC